MRALAIYFPILGSSLGLWGVVGPGVIRRVIWSAFFRVPWLGMVGGLGSALGGLGDWIWYQALLELYMEVYKP